MESRAEKFMYKIGFRQEIMETFIMLPISMVAPVKLKFT